MKLGYITDIHARSETPSGRTDNYNFSLFAKLEEAGHIFQRENCEAILVGGDWGDKPDIPNSVTYDLIGTLKAWGKPIYGIIGSHDYYGYQIKSLKRTAVGIINKSGVIQLISMEGMPDAVEVRDAQDRITICGTPHTAWLDDSPQNYYKKRYCDNFQIQLTHGDLMDKPCMWKHTLIENVKTESDIILGAHYHPGWNTRVQGNTTFLHPGAIARLDNTGKIRIPKVLILDIQGNKLVNYNMIPLTSAIEHPFKEKISESKENVSMSLIDSVLNLIQDTKVSTIDIKVQLPQIAKKLGYTDDVIEEAFSLIEMADK